MTQKKLTITILLIILLYIFLYFENNAIITTSLNLSLPELPKGFNGYTILQISDLHGKEFGKDNEKLISKIKQISPDIIVITGDLISSADYNEKVTLNFIDKITNISPVYFITGNHELNSFQYLTSLEEKLKSRNVHILRNTTDIIHKNGDNIILMGLDDPPYLYKSQNKKNTIIMEKSLKALIDANNKNMFKILLSHRPEQFQLYAKYNVNLTFTGHAHGGQFRFPLVGGFYAPSQGFFPKYNSGEYTLNNSTMVVSRGLGNGSIPQRLFNRPEIVIVTLNKI